MSDNGSDDAQQAERMAANDPYRWDANGWRSYRMLRPGRGMWYDVKRRLPYYWSDIKDGINYRTFAATIRIFFVKYVWLALRCMSGGKAY